MPTDTLTRRLPDLSDATDQQPLDEYIVIVFNNEVNTFDEVIRILQKATGCSLEEAQLETDEIDRTGRSVVHYGDQVECDRAASIIATIGIQVAVERL
jgi:ATP-dependent Clp protease adapter protein ClpS